MVIHPVYIRVGLYKGALSSRIEHIFPLASTMNFSICAIVFALAIVSSDAILRCEMCFPILNTGCCSQSRQCCPNKPGLCPPNPVANFNVLVACGRSCSDDAGCALQQKCCALGSNARCCVNPIQNANGALAEGLTKTAGETPKKN